MSEKPATIASTTARRVRCPSRRPEVRVDNFQEVPLGYTPEQAQAEAARCLQCKKPLCVEGCPVDVDIPGLHRLIAEGKFAEAARQIKETNCLPAVCGRVCPQETQCEERCVLGKKGEPVADRPPGAVRRRLRARARTGRAARKGPVHRQEGGRGRRRPGRD